MRERAAVRAGEEEVAQRMRKGGVRQMASAGGCL